VFKLLKKLFPKIFFGLFGGGQKIFRITFPTYTLSEILPVVPMLSIPIAAGDYLGVKYHKEIEYQVTEGALNKAVSGILEAVGIPSTPYPEYKR